MQIAAVHCWILPGGALSVFKDLLSQKLIDIPEAKIHIFTLISDQETLLIQNKKLPIIQALPGWISRLFLFFTTRKIFFFSWLFDYRNLMPIYPLLMKILSWKIQKLKPQEVIISSFAVAKNIDYCKSGKYFCHRPLTRLYLHSPMQYIWSHREDYFKKLTGIKRWIFGGLVNYLRHRDLKFTNYDEVISNSNYTASLAESVYGLESGVSYPKVSPAFFNQTPSQEPLSYYIYVGRLVRFVRETDLVITLFNKLKVPLLVMGSGPDEVYLKQLAGENIVFLGWIDDEQERIKIIKQAQGLINLTKESFGIGTAEALLLGVPVFGYNDGATPELVDEKSGIVSSSKTIKGLTEAFKRFSQTKRNREEISKNITKKLKNNSL